MEDFSLYECNYILNIVRSLLIKNYESRFILKRIETGFFWGFVAIFCKTSLLLSPLIAEHLKIFNNSLIKRQSRFN